MPCYSTSMRHAGQHTGGGGSDMCSGIVKLTIFALICLVLTAKSPMYQAGTHEMLMRTPNPADMLSWLSGKVAPVLLAWPIASRAAFAATYVMLQTLCLPGCVMLNLLAGALLGPAEALPLVAGLCAAGSWLCQRATVAGWGLVDLQLVMAYFPERLLLLRPQLELAKRQGPGSVLQHLVFLRLFPFTPGWFLNMSAGLFELAPSAVAASAAIGLLPYNYLAVKLGGDLANHREGTALSSAAVVRIAFAFLLVTAPVALRKVAGSLGEDQQLIGGAPGVGGKRL